MSDDEKIEPTAKKSKIDATCLQEDNVKIIKVGYNRCRKPLRTTELCKTTNLKKVSQPLANAFNAKYTINPELKTSDRLCYKCLLKVREMCESSESSSQSKSS